MTHCTHVVADELSILFTSHRFDPCKCRFILSHHIVTTSHLSKMHFNSFFLSVNLKKNDSTPNYGFLSGPLNNVEIRQLVIHFTFELQFIASLVWTEFGGCKREKHRLNVRIYDGDILFLLKQTKIDLKKIDCADYFDIHNSVSIFLLRHFMHFQD